MLANIDALATIAVKDTKAARKFYEGALGFPPAAGEQPGVLSYKSGTSTLIVYESRYAGTNQATAATWIVDDIEGVVKALNARGVTFEHYDFPGTTRRGDVHIMGKTRAAWFKDPDGNILSLVSR
jgi:catechol 2,3-dioxygenase-like lactoylglutathione lyase family enzyme